LRKGKEGREGTRDVGEMAGRERVKTVQAFKDLIVWQKAHDLFLRVAAIVESFPNKRGAWVVIDQILRSCGSISANISEGFGRKTRADYEHFLIIARGSRTETQNWLVKCSSPASGGAEDDQGIGGEMSEIILETHHENPVAGA
jgi:four helix bundle protein